VQIGLQRTAVRIDARQLRGVQRGRDFAVAPAGEIGGGDYTGEVPLKTTSQVVAVALGEENPAIGPGPAMAQRRRPAAES
jgi:hypothetical protein